MRQWTTVKAYSRRALHGFRTACNALLCRSQKVTCTVNSCVPIGPQSDTVAGIVAVEPASVIRELVYEDVLPTALHAILLRTQTTTVVHTEYFDILAFGGISSNYKETESEYAADDEGQETLDEASDVQEEPGNITHDKQLSLDDPVIRIDVATSNEPRWEDPVPPFHPMYKPTAFNYIYHPGLKLIAFHRQMGTPAPRQLQRLAAYYAFHCAN
eukprot:Em0352g1a